MGQNAGPIGSNGYEMGTNPPVKPVIAAFLLLSVQSVIAETFTGRVVSIADGDTVTLLDADLRQHKIRLIGIDAPEKRQAFGNRARLNLGLQVFGRDVTADCPKTDRYKRPLCKIEVDGTDANLAQIEAGMAWHYKAYQRDQRPADQARYAQAEARARVNRVGLWGDPAPVAPWEFRKARREGR